MTKLTKTSTPGIFRRHVRECAGGRCNCAYVIVWRHRGKQQTETFRTFAEAREAKGNREAGDKRPVSRIRFGEYFEEWIETYAGRTSQGFSESSRHVYRLEVSGAPMKRWKTWKLAEVEPADVRSLFGQMRRDDVSTVRLKRTRAALSAMFATAVDDGLLRSNPIAGVRIPASLDLEEDEEPQVKAMTREQLALVLFALPEKWKLFFELLTHSGLRIGEAVGLRWEHVDLGESPRLLVREQIYKGKRKKLKSKAGRRDIPLSPGMAARLLAHRRDRYGGADAAVFATGPGNPYLPQQIARDALNPAREAAGLGWVTFHTFRHTCASLLFHEGRNIKQVSEWLGHADPSFTLRTYVHLLDAGVGGAEFFDEVFVGARDEQPAPV